MNAEEVVRALGLLPHPEGGFYREIFRAPLLPFELPGQGMRNASTSIYFLLAGDDFSALHRVRSDEVWHHYLGATLELHRLDRLHGHTVTRLGSRLDQGERPQEIVPRDVYQAARLAPREPGETTPRFALCGCTVAPGFDFADFEMPPRRELLEAFPAHREVVELLTRTHVLVGKTTA
jgi:predicted cupin superfamily sugar epimerase